jgi:F-type H+-transporting ATPase subunit c
MGFNRSYFKFQEIGSVNKFAKIFGMAIAVLLVGASLAMAQDKEPVPLITFSASFGAGLVTVGAAYGISKLASSALESMARQPEVAGQIQTAMIIAAALIEGFTFFALFITFSAIGK